MQDDAAHHDRNVSLLSLVRRTALAAGIAVSLVAAPALARPGDAGASAGDDETHDDHRLEVETLLRFDATRGENPENITLDRHGNVYVALLFAHTLVRLDRFGGVTRAVLPAGQTAGIAIDPLHPDRLTVAVISPDPEVAGLWTVPLAAFHGGAAPSRAVALPANAFPNGITYDRQGNLYVADSTLARIWRVAAGSDTATIWLADPLLAQSGVKFGDVTLPGANGVKLARGRIWVSNSSTNTLLSAPLHRDGTAGTLTAAFTFDTLVGLDDFQITDRGEVIAALNGISEVVSISRDGKVRVLEDASAGVRNPSAVALTEDGDIYVTNSAFFSDSPSLQLIER